MKLPPYSAALVRLEAFPNLRLTGKVIRVGTLASSSIDRPLDEKRFDLVVELDPTEAELRPEMTARADIVTGNRDGVLLVPVNAVFDQQGTYVAHVAGLSGIETRPVELGESNDRVVEVLAACAAHLARANCCGRPSGHPISKFQIAAMTAPLYSASPVRHFG